MALSKEDKADVKGAMGKALANKVARVTRDSSPKEFKDYPGGKRQWLKEERDAKQFEPGGRYAAKADVKRAMGKALANKVASVTHDKSTIKSVMRHKAKVDPKSRDLRKETQSWHSAFKQGKDMPARRDYSIKEKITSKVNKPFKTEALMKAKRTGSRDSEGRLVPDADRNRDD